MTKEGTLYRIPDHLLISGDKTFYTLQGEGITIGKPAEFLRLHLCNLTCDWCDTRYTWDTSTGGFWNEYENWSIERTIQNVQNGWECDNPNIQKRLVITGGEPLMQKKKLDTVIANLPEWEIEIETNGTIMPTDLMLERCQINCSPKLKNSGVEYTKRIKPRVLNAINNVQRSFFKFVAQSPEDILEIEQEFVIPFSLDIHKIVVVPEGRSLEAIRQSANKIVEKVKQKGYRMIGRLHYDIWGPKRGV